MKRRQAGVAKRPLDRPEATHPKKTPLHLVHVTSVGSGREIVEQGVLEARYCKFFKKNLLYFFVDRPGYRTRESSEKSDQINRFPFVFITRLNEREIPHHAFPFDTGAALSGLFDDRADPYIPLDDYEIGVNHSSISAHINWAFETRYDYFEGNLRVGIDDELSPWDSIERSYLDIAAMASPTHNQPDKRASAVEIAFSSNIHLSSRSFRAIIPKQLIEHITPSRATLTNTKLISDLDKYNITWDPYDWMPGRTPAEFFQEIHKITWEIINGAR